MSYLVDANVLCEATRQRANSNVLLWLDRHDAELHVSVITLGEISKDIQLLPRSKKRNTLQKWFNELELSFDERILPVDRNVINRWATMYATSQRAGKLLPSFDSLLAATALHHNLTISTRNTDDFPSECNVVNPWGESQEGTSKNHVLSSIHCLD
jgi:predicted nucleic acid-binding protein